MDLGLLILTTFLLGVVIFFLDIIAIIDEDWENTWKKISLIVVLNLLFLFCILWMVGFSTRPQKIERTFCVPIISLQSTNGIIYQVCIYTDKNEKTQIIELDKIFHGRILSNQLIQITEFKNGPYCGLYSDLNPNYKTVDDPMFKERY